MLKVSFYRTNIINQSWKIPQTNDKYVLFGCYYPFVSRGANLSGSEVNAEEEGEAGVLVDRLDTTTTRYKMEIGPDKTKVMTKPKWLPKRDQDKRSEARRSGELQLLWSNHL